MGPRENQSAVLSPVGQREVSEEVLPRTVQMGPATSYCQGDLGSFGFLPSFILDAMGWATMNAAEAAVTLATDTAMTNVI